MLAIILTSLLAVAVVVIAKLRQTNRALSFELEVKELECQSLFGTLQDAQEQLLDWEQQQITYVVTQEGEGHVFSKWGDPHENLLSLYAKDNHPGCYGSPYTYDCMPGIYRAPEGATFESMEEAGWDHCCLVEELTEQW